MEFHQEVMLSNSSIVTQPLKPKPTSLAPNNGHSSSNGQKEGVVGNSGGYIGVLEVFIHQARDIHNICIYQKQDVYAKLCLSSDPGTTVSTHIINGGGQNPVFNENLKLNVKIVDSLLKCEIWMLSRVRNYLEDQLLGFALVPLTDVLIENGKLAQEFELSSSDMFHSPSGFVELTLAYTGSSPEVLEIPAIPSSLAVNAANQDSEVCDSIPCALDKIEFPDPKVANENEMMVTDYYTIPCPNVDSRSLEICETTEKDVGVGIDVVERFSKESHDTIEVQKVEIPPNSDLTVCDTPKASKSINDNGFSSLEEKKEDVKEADCGVSAFAQPLISIDVAPEQKVVQQEIVDMYNKSMKQFTEALAKMKLPMDMENGSAGLGNNDSDGKVQASKGKDPSPKVFYGSRAFF